MAPLVGGRRCWRVVFAAVATDRWSDVFAPIAKSGMERFSPRGGGACGCGRHKFAGLWVSRRDRLLILTLSRAVAGHGVVRRDRSTADGVLFCLRNDLRGCSRCRTVCNRQFLA